VVVTTQEPAEGSPGPAGTVLTTVPFVGENVITLQVSTGPVNSYVIETPC